jgi:hypothetical protein
MRLLITKWGRFVPLLLVVIGLSFFIISCSDTVNEPAVSTIQQGDLLTKDNPQMRAVIEVQERHTADLMNIADVIGNG